LLGLLHGILPDEHTWPITFSYAIGGASGKAGLRAGFYFALAFTVQRAFLSELSHLTFSRYLLTENINGIVYIAVGLAMAAAGAIFITRARPHSHLMGSSDEKIHAYEASLQPKVTPVKWIIIHGFIAGFAFEGLFASVLTVATPAMPSVWLGFLPGLFFGLGTMLVLMVVGLLFGSFFRWIKSLTEQEIARIGADTGARTLFYGGLLFIAFGAIALLGWSRFLPIDPDYLIIAAFSFGIAIPAFIYSWRRVVAARGVVG
jgi:sulfite exporter TauE/SafE